MGCVQCNLFKVFSILICCRRPVARDALAKGAAYLCQRLPDVIGLPLFLVVART